MPVVDIGLAPGYAGGGLEERRFSFWRMAPAGFRGENNSMNQTWTRVAALLCVAGSWTVATAPCEGAATVDQVNDVGGSSAALFLMPSNFHAQSFTVGVDGLLSQIDVQVGKYAGATGDVRFELRPLVNGKPTLDDRGTLFMSTILINDIPVINSLADPPTFVSVDVSAAGIHAKPGDQFAISLRRSGSTPAAAWRSKPNSYAGGIGFFRSLLSSPWNATVEDYGFRTLIDPTPTAPYKLRTDATFDMQYRPSTGSTKTLIDGEDSLAIGGFAGSTTFPEQRPILEFPLAGLPANAVISAAHLEFDWYVSSGEPRIEIMGYAGDGLASFGDVTAAGTLLGITEPTSASSSSELPIDANFVAGLVGQATHLGVRLRSLDLPEYVGFNATEDDFPTTLPPRLVIEYTLPGLLGDFNQDEIVDGADFLQWQREYGGAFNAADLADWKANFGTAAGSGATAMPEPQGFALAAVALAAAAGSGLRNRR
jgi:hypothetical protein